MFHKNRVRYDEGNIIVGNNRRAARPDVSNPAGHGMHLDPIANLDRTFGQQDQPADEVAGDVLEAQTHTHPYGAGEYGESGEINTGVLQSEIKAYCDNGVTDNLGDCILD